MTFGQHALILIGTLGPLCIGQTTNPFWDWQVGSNALSGTTTPWGGAGSAGVTKGTWGTTYGPWGGANMRGSGATAFPSTTQEPPEWPFLPFNALKRTRLRGRPTTMPGGFYSVTSTPIPGQNPSNIRRGPGRAGKASNVKIHGVDLPRSNAGDFYTTTHVFNPSTDPTRQSRTFANPRKGLKRMGRVDQAFNMVGDAYTTIVPEVRNVGKKTNTLHKNLITGTEAKTYPPDMPQPDPNSYLSAASTNPSKTFGKKRVANTIASNMPNNKAVAGKARSSQKTGIGADHLPKSLQNNLTSNEAHAFNHNARFINNYKKRNSSTNVPSLETKLQQEIKPTALENGTTAHLLSSHGMRKGLDSSSNIAQKANNTTPVSPGLNDKPNSKTDRGRQLSKQRLSKTVRTEHPALHVPETQRGSSAAIRKTKTPQKSFQNRQNQADLLSNSGNSQHHSVRKASHKTPPPVKSRFSPTKPRSRSKPEILFSRRPSVPAHVPEPRPPRQLTNPPPPPPPAYNGILNRLSTQFKGISLKLDQVVQTLQNIYLFAGA